MSNVQNDSVAASATGTTLTPVGSAKAFNMSFAVDVTGTITFLVEVTYNGTAFHTVAASGTVSVDGAVTSPIAGIRARSTAGTGTLVLTVIED
jgi:hypothetical protein